MKLKIKFKIIIAVVLTLTAITAGGGWYLSGLVVEPKVWNFDVTLENEIKNKRFEEAWYNVLPKEEMTIDSPNGYKLNAVYVPAGTDKTIVFVHGHTYTLHGDYKYLEMFRSRGFKSAVTKHINITRKTPGLPVWQRNYSEHIIRDDESFYRISEYIKNNPANWKKDNYYA